MQPTYTTAEVAEILSLSTKTITKYLKEGRLRAYKIGGVYRIPDDAVNDFIESTKVNFHPMEKGE